MTKTLVEEYVADPLHMRLFQQERAIFEVTEQLEEAMREGGVSRSELATRLGKTKGWVTQLLDGEANKTIRTVADAFAVLGLAYRSFYGPIQLSNAPTAPAASPVRAKRSVIVSVEDDQKRPPVTSARVESIQLKIAG